MFSHILFLSPLALQAIAFPSHLESRAGPCRKPSVRQEWRNFSKQQKTAWIDAFKCLESKPHDPTLQPVPSAPGLPPMNTTGSLYDDFTYVHINLYPFIHFNALFLPWHRWYLHTLEQLVETECGYKGPMGYWDWTKDASNLKESTMFDGNKKSGLGGFGKANNDFVVKDDAFADSVRSYPSPHTISRNFSETPFDENRFQPTPWIITKPKTRIRDVVTPGTVQSVINGHQGDFKGFLDAFDIVEGFHTGVHLMVGGDLMDPAISPNDPLFFLHHGMLDRVWYLWQKKSTRNKKAFSGGLTPGLATLEQFLEFRSAGMDPQASLTTPIPNANFRDAVTVGDVLDTESGYLCYVYE